MRWLAVVPFQEGRSGCAVMPVSSTATTAPAPFVARHAYGARELNPPLPKVLDVPSTDLTFESFFERQSHTARFLSCTKYVSVAGSGGLASAVRM